MFLYFRSADVHYAEAGKFLSRLRRKGYLTCTPLSDLAAEALSVLPFTACILHFSARADGLPHPRALREIFPSIPLIAVGCLASDRFRTIPETDYEFSPDAFFSDADTLLARFSLSHTESLPARSGVYFPETGGKVVLSSSTLELTPAEYTLLRVLSAVDAPLSAELLSGFTAHPGSRHPSASVPVHISHINAKARAHALPRPIGPRRGYGYILRPPYAEFLSPERITIIH